MTRPDQTRPDQTRPDQTRPDQTRPDQTNYDLLYDKEYYREHIGRTYFSDRKLTYKTIHGGYLFISDLNVGFFDSGVFNINGDYIEGTNLHNHSKAQKIVKLSENELKSSKRNNSTVIYAGLFFGLWGHFLTDCMKKLWFLKSKDYAENFSECPIVYIPMAGFKFEGNYRRFIEILGIDCSKFTPVTELTQYDSVIVPDESFFCSDHGYFFTDVYKAMIDCVRNFAVNHCKLMKTKKVYYSHSRLGNGREFGEDKLERYFASKGYTVVYPEKLSLDEQLNILANCESFASTIGSCSHNTIFLRENTEVILIPRSSYLTGYQETINQLYKQRINYVDSTFSIFAGKAPWGGPFLYFISSNLRKFFHDEDTNHIIDASDFWKYLRSASGYKFGKKTFGNIGVADNPDVYRYYSKIAAEYFSQIFKSSWPYKLREFIKKLLGRK